MIFFSTMRVFRNELNNDDSQVDFLIRFSFIEVAKPDKYFNINTIG